MATVDVRKLTRGLWMRSAGLTLLPPHAAVRLLIRLASAFCLAALAGCSDLSVGGSDNIRPVSLAASPSGPQSADPAVISAQFTSAATPGNSAYRIGPLDVLDVTVFKVPDLSRSVQVGETGDINFPLVGQVHVAGQTAQAAERELAGRLGARYLQSPQVTVFVKEYNSQRVTMEGAVKKPGVYPLRGKVSLLQFIAQSEGLDRDTASGTVVIFRQTPSGRAAARFSVDDIRAGRADDPAMEPGDVIVADSSTAKVTLSYFLKALPAASVFTSIAAL